MQRSVTIRTITMVVMLIAAAPAAAAYFHEAHRSDALLLSDLALKERFVVTAPIAVTPLSAPDAAAILAAPDAPGLFEQPGGIRVPSERCGEDTPKARHCELDWEAKNLAKSNGVAARKAGVLRLKGTGGRTLVLRDWHKCAPQGECDGERFTYLGPLDHSAYHAVEIGYGHDSPSLILFAPSSGKMLAVHYGSEPTFVNPARSLLVSSEDLNDATSLLVTSLIGGAPAIDLQCLGARTKEKSFAVTFKRWTSASGFELVLTESVASTGAGAPEPKTIAVHFERGADGAWTLRSPIDLKAEGFECRARGTLPAQ